MQRTWQCMNAWVYEYLDIGEPGYLNAWLSLSNNITRDFWRHPAELFTRCAAYSVYVFCMRRTVFGCFVCDVLYVWYNLYLRCRCCNIGNVFCILDCIVSESLYVKHCTRSVWIHMWCLTLCVHIRSIHYLDTIIRSYVDV